jgi:hypothetical protein
MGKIGLALTLTGILAFGCSFVLVGNRTPTEIFGAAVMIVGVILQCADALLQEVRLLTRWKCRCGESEIPVGAILCPNCGSQRVQSGEGGAS